ncbi:MAG TPA: 50S ribosomal protein L24, partial [Saprospiraceae bacterium]|nr:50S ribosomal protein L24 [Saprospiraceae bacterium]
SNKGQTGEVKAVYPSENRALIEGVNMVRKHVKGTQANPGGIPDIEAPLHISNLMWVDPKTGNPTRVGRKVVDNKIVRYSKKSGEIIK